MISILPNYAAIAAATCQVDYKVIGTTMKWTLTGPEAAVEEKVAKLLRRYPSEGYGTCVERRKDGSVVVTAYSCE